MRKVACKSRVTYSSRLSGRKFDVRKPFTEAKTAQLYLAVFIK